MKNRELCYVSGFESVPPDLHVPGLILEMQKNNYQTQNEWIRMDTKCTCARISPRSRTEKKLTPDNFLSCQRRRDLRVLGAT
jgi:hypothetical protein